MRALGLTGDMERGARDLRLEPGASWDRILLSVRLRARRRVAWLRKLWSEEEPPGGKVAVTHGEADTLLLDRDSPDAESAWMVADPFARRLSRDIAALEEEMAREEASRFSHARRLFGLSDEEADFLRVCLALSVDPSLGRVYAYLQDHAGRGYATEELAGRLFGHGRTASLGSQSPLRLWELLHEREVAPAEPRLFTCDPFIRDWMEGKEGLDPFLVGIAHLRGPLRPLQNWPVEETALSFERMAHEGPGVRMRVRITGVQGSGRRTLAACISDRLDLGLLALDADRIPDAQWQRAYMRAQRYGLLTGCALAWSGGKASLWRWPAHVPSFPLQFVISEPGEIPHLVDGMTDSVMEMPLPSLEERRRLWRDYVPVSATWKGEEARPLISRHRVTVGVIADVARSGVRTAREAASLVRHSTRGRLGELVQLLECPFVWDDLVVPGHIRDVLGDIVFEAKDRAAFWEEPRTHRLFPQGRGLFVLFAGPSGVGKTMAAQVIAGVLQRDVYRCDLSTVVSKWVGETSKNLSRILTAIPNDEVILFDEADALFGRRLSLADASDANSRLLAGETAHLLQAVESYRGVVILSSNRRGDIDPAFVRRLRYIVDFPKPDSASRLRIWQRIIVELAGEERVTALNESLAVLAREVKATGAQIKFSLLSALFTARREGEPLQMKHILHGLEQELRKEGREWNQRERQRLIHNVG